VKREAGADFTASTCKKAGSAATCGWASSAPHIWLASFGSMVSPTETSTAMNSLLSGITLILRWRNMIEAVWLSSVSLAAVGAVAAATVSHPHTIAASRPPSFDIENI